MREISSPHFKFLFQFLFRIGFCVFLLISCRSEKILKTEEKISLQAPHVEMVETVLPLKPEVFRGSILSGDTKTVSFLPEEKGFQAFRFQVVEGENVRAVISSSSDSEIDAYFTDRSGKLEGHISRPGLVILSHNFLKSGEHYLVLKSENPKPTHFRVGFEVLRALPSEVPKKATVSESKKDGSQAGEVVNQNPKSQVRLL